MDTKAKKTVTAAMRAEASAWIARLHGPARDARTEAGFRTWLSADAAHARAFEQTTEAWEAAGSIPSGMMSPMVHWNRVGARRGHMRTAFAAAAAVVLAIAGSLYYVRTSPIQTDVGEQRAITLKDGTRVHLNTASRLRVRYDRHARHVELQAGEALFEVARQAARPFIVTAGDRQITALGTSFVVRREGHSTVVTLMTGAVAVASTHVVSSSTTPAAAEPRILAPGQRLTFTDSSPPSMDRPALEQVTAWQRGLVILDKTRLAEAVREMNRYSSMPLKIDSPQMQDLLVSGAFRAGDSLSFAQAVAATYRIEVLEEQDRIVLSGLPHATYRQP